MLTASPGLALARRGRKRLGHRWRGGCVARLRLRRGASLSGRLLGSCSSGRSPLRGSFAKWCGRIAASFCLGSSTRDGGGLLFGIVLLGCLSSVLVVRMVPLDRLFFSLGRFQRLEAVQ